MKLAAITDEISQDLAHALDVLAEYGATGAEIRGVWGTNIADLSRDDVLRAKALLDERGFTVPALSTPFFKCDIDAEAAQEAGPLHLAKPRALSDQMDVLRRCIDAAHTFGTTKLRVFSFWKKSAYTPEIEDRIIDAFDEPLALAQSEGITLLLENEHSCYVGTGAETARIVERIDSPALRVVWDPGNAFAAGEKPYPDGYDAVKSMIGHVHVKDGRIEQTEQGPKVRFCVIGEGEIDYRGQLSTLRADGYT
jgi:sugar phosphate isomerase/epimerase